jgi:hypothetical protein
VVRLSLIPWTGDSRCWVRLLCLHILLRMNRALLINRVLRLVRSLVVMNRASLLILTLRQMTLLRIISIWWIVVLRKIHRTLRPKLEQGENKNNWSEQKF